MIFFEGFIIVIPTIGLSIALCIFCSFSIYVVHQLCRVSHNILSVTTDGSMLFRHINILAVKIFSSSDWSEMFILTYFCRLPCDNST